MILPMKTSPHAMVAIAAALLSAVVTAQTPDPANPRFPDGPGKAALFKVCGPCHGAESAVGQLKTRDEWSKTLDEMAAAGAEGTDEEWNQILEYLDKNFSMILINKADAKQLANALDVPQATAESVVKYREEHGRIASLEDLKKVPGLDPAKLDARKDRFVF
jgi:competence protein ComEA